MLSTSPKWQTWLYHYNQAIYNQFIKELKQSKGCDTNRKLMERTLKKIQDAGDSNKLLQFLQTHYPETIKQETKPVFVQYKPGILTYPRRVILTGSDLRQQVKQFTKNKIKHDSIIINDTAYVEYLNQEDRHIINKIPLSNWQIVAYRKNKL